MPVYVIIFHETWSHLLFLPCLLEDVKGHYCSFYHLLFYCHFSSIIEHPPGQNVQIGGLSVLVGLYIFFKVIVSPQQHLKLKTQHKKCQVSALENSEDGITSRYSTAAAPFILLSIVHGVPPPSQLHSFVLLAVPVNVVFSVCSRAGSIEQWHQSKRVCYHFIIFTVEKESVLQNSISQSLVHRPLVCEVKIVFIIIVRCYCLLF